MSTAMAYLRISRSPHTMNVVRIERNSCCVCTRKRTTSSRRTVLLLATHRISLSFVNRCRHLGGSESGVEDGSGDIAIDITAVDDGDGVVATPIDIEGVAEADIGTGASLIDADGVIDMDDAKDIDGVSDIKGVIIDADGIAETEVGIVSDGIKLTEGSGVSQGDCIGVEYGSSSGDIDIDGS